MSATHQHSDIRVDLAYASRMPTPDEEVRNFTVGDFLLHAAEAENIHGYRDLLSLIPKVNSIIPQSFRFADGIPELRITSKAEVDGNAGDLVHTVFLSRGMLDMSLNIGRDGGLVLRKAAFPLAYRHATLSRIFFLWSYMHEVTHIIRRHALLMNHFSGSRSTRYATEYDADMCAVATIYRMVRHDKPHYDPLRCKVLTLIGLYWNMRVLADRDVDVNGTESHPAFAARIVDMHAKLAMMNDFEADPLFKHPQTRSDHRILLAKVIELERLYMRTVHPNQPLSESVLRRYADGPIMSTAMRDRHRAWDEMSPRVSQLSLVPRSVIDNERPVLFFGDEGISAPLKSEQE